MNSGRLQRAAALLLVVLLAASCGHAGKHSSTETDGTKGSKSVAKGRTAVKERSAAKANEVADGWLKESVAQKVVLSRLGNPESRGDDEYWEATGTYVQSWEYPSLGVVLQMESDSKGGAKVVRGITLEEPCRFTTSQGVGIGTLAGQVRKRYAGLIDREGSDEETIVVGSVYGGTIFTVADDAVTRIFIGAAAE